jgi:hypothetical protein
LVKADVWQRDSNGLYDYEWKQRDTPLNLRVFSSRKITLNKKFNYLKEHKDSSQGLKPDENTILNLVYSEGSYWIYHSDNLNLNIDNKGIILETQQEEAVTIEKKTE